MTKKKYYENLNLYNREISDRNFNSAFYNISKLDSIKTSLTKQIKNNKFEVKTRFLENSLSSQTSRWIYEERQRELEDISRKNDVLFYKIEENQEIEVEEYKNTYLQSHYVGNLSLVQSMLFITVLVMGIVIITVLNT
ncbi:MAG: hypothetical protein PHY47_09630 [Lachnospiraceae bacterium]|nr:hypothetical protein [Lachnospiraceae bacterium]